MNKEYLEYQLNELVDTINSMTHLAIRMNKFNYANKDYPELQERVKELIKNIVEEL